MHILKDIPFPVGQKELEEMAYNDNVYAWLLLHSRYNEGENHNYIYKKDFTYKQIATDIHKSRDTVSRRFNDLLGLDKNGERIVTKDGLYKKQFIKEVQTPNGAAYALPHFKPFQYLDGDTILGILNLTLSKEYKEETIKVLAYLLEKAKIVKKEHPNATSFPITAKELLEYFGHTLKKGDGFARMKTIMVILKGLGIIDYKQVHELSRGSRAKYIPLLYITNINRHGRANKEQLGLDSKGIPILVTDEDIEF